ncbi:hypothetical protein L5G28_01145 [Gordonia sp. HY285]|uniref:hypothetical protein n=1 Tax=Gordonia liuliyuniae TaxID=2911517 RepID=UPI001F41F04D|nr:hypothetical protein [Gordonia liuliyuniae]MCF8608770.1 hypothetical protein [Gordonia liuliyuniae]
MAETADGGAIRSIVGRVGGLRSGRRRAADPLPTVVWSPVTMLLSLGRAVLLTRSGPNTALTLPYGFGSVVMESAAT